MGYWGGTGGDGSETARPGDGGSVDELVRVKGIGKKSLAKMKHEMTVK